MSGQIDAATQVWSLSCVLIHNHFKKWKITTSWPLFVKNANCASCLEWKRMFTLYFHSCLISFLNSIRVERGSYGRTGSFVVVV